MYFSDGSTKAIVWLVCEKSLIRKGTFDGIHLWFSNEVPFVLPQITFKFNFLLFMYFLNFWLAIVNVNECRLCLVLSGVESKRTSREFKCLASIVSGPCQVGKDIMKLDASSTKAQTAFRIFGS